MVTSYPVNDYRGYLAHASKADRVEWQKHKYLKKVWNPKTGKFDYIYDDQSERRRNAESVESRSSKEEGSKNSSEHTLKSKGMIAGYRVTKAAETGVKTATKAAVAVGDAAVKAGQAVAGAANDAYHAVEGAIGSGVDWAKNFAQEQAQVYQFDKDKGEIMRDPEDPQKPLYADTIAGNTVRIANEVADWASQAFSDVKNWITNAATDVGKWVVGVKNGIVENYNKVKSFVSGIASSLINSSQVQAVIGTLKAGFGAVKTGLVNAYKAVAEFVTSLPDKAAAAIKGLTDSLGLSNQIDNAFDQAQEDALNNQAEEVKRGGRGGNF